VERQRDRTAQVSGQLCQQLLESAVVKNATSGVRFFAEFDMRSVLYLSILDSQTEHALERSQCQIDAGITRTRILTLVHEPAHGVGRNVQRLPLFEKVIQVPDVRQVRRSVLP
jgi:hypothetical protein